MQFGLAQFSLQTEQKLVIESGRIVKAVGIQDQSASVLAQLHQPVPIRAVPRQAGDLQSHNDPGLAERHFADQLLESLAARRLRRRLAQITINYMDVLGGPTERHRSLAQRILTLRALRVLQHLARHRLTNVEMRVPLQMGVRDF